MVITNTNRVYWELQYLFSIWRCIYLYTSFFLWLFSLGSCKPCMVFSHSFTNQTFRSQIWFNWILTVNSNPASRIKYKGYSLGLPSSSSELKLIFRTAGSQMRLPANHVPSPRAFPGASRRGPLAPSRRSASSQWRRWEPQTSVWTPASTRPCGPRAWGEEPAWESHWSPWRPP